MLSVQPAPVAVRVCAVPVTLSEGVGSVKRPIREHRPPGGASRRDRRSEIDTPEEDPIERRPTIQAAGVVAGVLVLGVSTLLLGRPHQVVPNWEQSAFHRVNGLSDAWRLPLVIEMQLGTLPAIVVVAGGLYVSGRRRGAAAAATAGILAWAVAKWVKVVVGRGRPADLLDQVRLRQAHFTGLGFVSGHTAVSFALATVVTPHLRGRWRIVPLALASLVGFARMYVGAHLPLDVAGGAGLGIACGSIATWAFGQPPPSTASGRSLERA